MELIDGGPETGLEKRCFVPDSSESGCNQLKIPIAGLESFSLGTENCSLVLVEKIVLCVPIITANPSLDELSPKGSKPLLSNGRVVELAPIRRDIELPASELTPFLPSVAFRGQQLRSSAHFNPWPRHK
ncbi:hypothetical protein PIB30_090076, partial [Stylosanthes scabra]|nr:hypothetical protein [Stylosanthes scabra]